MYNEQSIGVRIAELRANRKLSRIAFAGLMMVSPQAVGKWERGESLPDVMTLKRIAELLDVDISVFFDALQKDGEQEMQVKPGGQNIQKPEWNFSVSNWKNANFSGLKNIAEKFSCANITNCNFSDSVLSGIRFKRNNIRKCDFTHTDLSESELAFCNLPDNCFLGCCFQQAKLSHSDIHGSNFTNADFTGAAIIGICFQKNVIDHAKFYGTTFTACVFSHISVTSDLSECSFENCTFRDVTFQNMTFRNTFFKNQRNKRITFINCKADNLSYSFLRHSRADLTGLDCISPLSC